MPDENTQKLLLESLQDRIAGNRKFDEVDLRATEAASRILQAAAKLAEEKPDEFFGLRPTELQRLVLDRLGSPTFAANLAAMGGTGAHGDVVGAQDDSGLTGKLTDFFGDVFGKLDIPGRIIDLIKAEKDYWLGRGRVND